MWMRIASPSPGRGSWNWVSATFFWIFFGRFFFLPTWGVSWRVNLMCIYYCYCYSSHLQVDRSPRWTQKEWHTTTTSSMAFSKKVCLNNSLLVTCIRCSVMELLRKLIILFHGYGLPQAFSHTWLCTTGTFRSLSMTSMADGLTAGLCEFPPLYPANSLPSLFSCFFLTPCFIYFGRVVK